MKITHIQGSSAEVIAATLRHTFASSRFVLDVAINKEGVNISKVRLNTAKQFCGNHPKACEGNPNAKHRKMACMEGADWVEFDDSLNDLLDSLGVSARVQSSQVHIREGKLRRVDYREDKLLGVPGSNAAWTWLKRGTPEHYQDWTGLQAPPSAFPKGTPGIYLRIGYNVEG